MFLEHTFRHSAQETITVTFASSVSLAGTTEQDTKKTGVFTVYFFCIDTGTGLNLYYPTIQPLVVRKASTDNRTDSLCFYIGQSRLITVGNIRVISLELYAYLRKKLMVGRPSKFLSRLLSIFWFPNSMHRTSALCSQFDNGF